MDGILQTTEAFLREHQMWAGVTVGLVAFGESLVLVGLLIPATALMVLIGGLVGAGVIDPVPVVLGAVIGAVLGDIVSYGLGRVMGSGIVHRWPLKRYRSGVAQARLFFRKYGFAAIFFGRFFGPLRSTVPLVAGMMAMDQKRFQLANIGSALVWAPLMLAPGWLAAKGASRFGELNEFQWLGLGIGLTGVTFLGAVLIAWILRKITPQRRRAGQLQ